MDAFMIVHQLQRLAAEPRPSPAVRTKIPRMAVGICYFLEHPDPGVQHQAAGALRLLLQQHRQLLLQAAELQELRVALQQHVNSTDVVVSECCAATLALLEQRDQQEHEEADQQQHQQNQQQQLGLDADVETLECLDLFSVVLGLRGLLRCPSDRSLLTFKHQQDDGQEQQQERQRQRKLELLQRNLQLRLVRVWGVSSATVTLNTEGLLRQAAAMDAGTTLASEERQPSEEGDGIAVVNIRLSRRAQRLQQQLRELRAAVGPLTLLLNSQLLQKASQKRAQGASEGLPSDAVPPISKHIDSISSQPVASCHHQQQQQQHQRQENGYLDDELRDNWEGSKDGSATAQTAASSNGGFSFFSANSALFAQSRFMGGMITPAETSTEMTAKLKAEKERKANLRAQSQGGLIDRLLGRLGSGAGLL